MTTRGLSGYMQMISDEWIPTVAKKRNADLERRRVAVNRANSAIERHNSVRPKPGDVATANIPLPPIVPREI